MTLASPTIEWRAFTTPFGLLSSIAPTGTGASGAIPAGTNSATLQVRIYNNYAAVTNIADATNCTLAVYDDAVHQGLAVTTPTVGQYVTVEVNNYNTTNTTGADTVFYAIGGVTKHPIPVNSGTIAGSGGGGSTNTNYVSLTIEVQVPANATQGAVAQGLWVEYSSTA